MNREEAIKVFEEIKVNYDNDPDWGVYDGVFSRRNLTEILDAYAVLRSPWVKTADRLPDAEQIARNDKIFLLCKQHDGTYEAYTHWADGLASHPEKFEFDYWMPVPPRPGAVEPETGEMAPNGDEGARE